jgi:hypothetical protein
MIFLLKQEREARTAVAVADLGEGLGRGTPNYAGSYDFMVGKSARAGRTGSDDVFAGLEIRAGAVRRTFRLPACLAQASSSMIELSTTREWMAFNSASSEQLGIVSW